MIERLKVRNFRCFEELDLGPLSRVNIIVGDNASGKTALLEALFFAAAGSPELAVRFRAWRGAESIQVTRERSGYEELWRELFYRLDDKRVISAEAIGSFGSFGNSRSVEVLYEEGQVALPLDGQKSSSVESPAIRLITFRGKDIAGHEFRVQPEISDRGLIPATTGENVPASYFSATLKASAAEAARRFSEFSKAKAHRPIVEALHEQFPFLDDLSIEIDGGIGLIHATIKGIDQKLRLGLVSGGLDRLVSSLVAIQANAHGFVALDEIENGIFHNKLTSLWAMLLAFGNRHDTQLFVSTHSLECLKALLPTLKHDEHDFVLIHCQRSDNQCTVRRIAGANVRAAIEEGIEVR